MVPYASLIPRHQSRGVYDFQMSSSQLWGEYLQAYPNPPSTSSQIFAHRSIPYCNSLSLLSCETTEHGWTSSASLTSCSDLYLTYFMTSYSFLQPDPLSTFSLKYQIFVLARTQASQLVYQICASAVSFLSYFSMLSQTHLPFYNTQYD